MLALAVTALTWVPVHPAQAAPSRCGQHPWCDTTLGPDRRADLLEAQLTTDEKVRLLGGDVSGEAPHTGASFAIDRLGIPAVLFSDGPVGPRQGSATAMPIPMALAATWDPALAREHGTEIATEAKAKGNDVVFAPTVNILRNPQGGRSYEAYGEEPFLTARTAVSWIQGAQSTGVVADVKHFAANNQEGQLGVPPLSSALGSRNLVNVVVDERTLREVYFPHFEAAVKQAEVGTVMCSYNKVDGAYSCQNPHDTQQVLERDWGFAGIVLSDYGAAHDTGPSLTSGLDFEPSGPALALTTYNPQQIGAALALGQATTADLDGHVHRILRTMFAYGLFDRAAYTDDDAQIDKAHDQQVAEHIEEQAITLLRNKDTLLPLSKAVRSIAVIGPYADRFVTGGGSGAVTPFAVTTALAGIRARAGSGVTVTYVDGSDRAAAAAAAKAADVAVVVVGDVESEGQDKSCISLSCTTDLSESEAVLVTEGSSCPPQSCPLNGTDDDGLVSAVAAANPRTVVVLETGAPVLTPWRDQVGAVLEAWYPGQAGGTALARVLFGDVEPGGRLPATFPASADQLPTAGDLSRYPGVGETETYSEGLDVGYRWFDDHHLTPAFAFGDGLSYSTFSFADLAVSKGTSGSQDVATVSVTVTNTGSRTGIAVPELYLGKPSTMALPQPVRQLAGYAKVPLAPGASRRVSFPLNDRSFASWDDSLGTAADPSGSWVVPSGCFTVSVGASSRDLPLRTTIGQGASCATAALTLSSTAPSLASLPLPGDPRIVSVARPASSKPVHRSPSRHVSAPGSLAATGLGPGVCILAGLIVTVGLALRRWRVQD